MYVYEWGGCFWTSGSSKDPYVLLSASGTLGLVVEPRNKAVCSFPGRPLNKCLSQSPLPMGGKGKRGFRYVHNYEHRQIQHICITHTGYIAVFKYSQVILFLTSSFLYLYYFYYFSSVSPHSPIISLRRCHLLHSVRYTMYPSSNWKSTMFICKEPGCSEGWSRCMRITSRCGVRFSRFPWDQASVQG